MIMMKLVEVFVTQEASDITMSHVKRDVNSWLKIVQHGVHGGNIVVSHTEMNKLVVLLSDLIEDDTRGHSQEDFENEIMEWAMENDLLIDINDGADLAATVSGEKWKESDKNHPAADKNDPAVIDVAPGKNKKIPLSAVFKGKPPYRLKKSDYEKREYTHGAHRVVGHPAIMSSTVIDPHAWWRIEHLKAGQNHKFKDETGAEWQVERGNDGKMVKFFSLDSAGHQRQRSEGDWEEMIGALR
jgi:hypothetical protein